MYTLTKKYYILIVFVITILISSLVFSGCTRKDDEMGDDYIFFEMAGMESRDLRISKSGRVEQADVNFGNSWILETYNTCTLSEGDMDKLSEFIEKSGFFKLKGAYPRVIYPFIKHFMIVDRGYYRISVYKEGKVKTVYDYYNAAPDAFWDILDYLRKKIEPKLKSDPRYGTFIMAKWLKGSTSENIINEEELKAHPFLAEAVYNPGWFIYVGTLADAGLDNYIDQDRNYFFLNFEGSKIYIEVYERTE